jgi:high affinity sulfate transporter 1
MTGRRPSRGLAILARYERGWLGPDLVAGVTVAAYLVPQVMAYAQLAGLTPVVGLWSAILPGIVYALLGTSRHVSIGPESTTAIMVAAAIAPIAGSDPARYAALAAGLAVITGLVCVAGALLRLGFLGDLLSHPLLVGYMAGVALLMIVSQLSNLTGIPVEGGSVIEDLVDVLTNLGSIHGPTMVLGAGVVVFLLVARRLVPWLPGPLVAVVGTSLIVELLGLVDRGVGLVGPIPSGLPPLGLPAIEPTDIGVLMVAAVGVALVAYTDDLLTARAFAGRHGDVIDANAELAALGVAQVAAGLSSGMPIGSSGSRSAIVESVGGRSPAVGVVAVACVIVVLVALGGALERIPTAALAGLVVYAALRLIDAAAFRRLARFRPSELGLALAAAAGVLAFGVLVGIVLAISLSVIDLFARVARPEAAILGRPPGVAGLHDIEDYPDAETVPGLVVFRYDAPLCFANANDFKTRALGAVDRQADRVEWLLLNAEAIVEIDLTAADALGELHDELERRGIVLAMARVKQDLRDQLERIGLITHLGADRLYPTLPVALEAFERRARDHPSRDPR